MQQIKKKLKAKKEVIFLTIFGFIVASITSIATVTYFSQSDIQQKEYADSQVLSANTVNFEPNPELENKNTFTFLLLGYGGAGHQGGFLTDVIQIAHFNFETKKIYFISIPRDLYVSLPNGTTGKINKAFTLGDSNDPIHSGAEVAKQMATAVTGIPLDSFISIDFNGFKRAVGGPLDGIEVNVTETLDDPWYPIKGEELNTCGMSPEKVTELSNTLSGFELEKQFECRYEHIYYPAGKHHMEGGDALAYVRSRHGSAGGDFSRSRRQQELLLAVREKLFQLDALNKIPAFFKELIAHTDTDLDLEIVQTLAPQFAKSLDMETKNITLSTHNVFTNSKSSDGAYIVIPKAGMNNWDETRDFVASELNQ